MASQVEVQLTPALALLESDAFYFELAAQRLRLSFCEIAFVPDLIELPVSCVGQHVDEKRAAADPLAFLHEFADACHALGAPLARFYLSENTPKLEAFLLSQGFHTKTEIGYLASPTNGSRPVNDVSLRRVITDNDWQVKLMVHGQEDVGSDGYRNQAADWKEIINRKCQTGFKQTFLILYQGLPAGSIGIVEAPGMRRVKNLFVIPKYRGLGVAAAAVNLLLEEAAQQSIPVVGVFGIKGSSGCAVYESCGFQPATRQVEYTKPLDRNRRNHKVPRHPR